MSRRLFWRLILSISVGTLILLSVLHSIANYLTIQMTVPVPQHQAVLTKYAETAQRLYQQGDQEGLLQLIETIANQHQAWSALLLLADNTLLTSRPLPPHLQAQLNFQRQIDWPVHPFMQHVLIGFPLPEINAVFVLELPATMHPKPNTLLVHNFITIIMPMIILSVFCWMLYRHLMQPLEALNKATLAFATGDLTARVSPHVTHRRDELTQLGNSFNRMADQIERLVHSQRQLLGDLSHELRTPLTRCELALELNRSGGCDIKTMLPRLQRDMQQMHTLVDNTLTLAWLDGEQQIERNEAFNLATLFDLLCDDVEFEFVGRRIERHYAAECYISHCNQRALSQSLENILRNALKYSPSDRRVHLRCTLISAQQWRIEVIDEGIGVATADLENIFTPFFRTDKARSREVGGFGLGLALAKRHIEAIGGEIYAQNDAELGGLRVVIELPST